MAGSTRNCRSHGRPTRCARGYRAILQAPFPPPITAFSHADHIVAWLKEFRCNPDSAMAKAGGTPTNLAPSHRRNIVKPISHVALLIAAARKSRDPYFIEVPIYDVLTFRKTDDQSRQIFPGTQGTKVLDLCITFLANAHADIPRRPCSSQFRRFLPFAWL